MSAMIATPFCPNSRRRRPDAARPPARHGERGYALVALLAVMAVILIMATAAAPRAQQQTQRELEKESIARGEEVAEAIARYASLMGRLPNSLDELTDGVTPPNTIKEVQILRRAAARDPLATTRDGEWKIVRQNDRAFTDFTLGVMKYSGGVLPRQRIYQFPVQIQPPAGGLVDLKEQDEPEGGEDSESNTSGPFIGVVSRSRRKSVLHYYGIERHDRWVFTPLFR